MGAGRRPPPPCGRAPGPSSASCAPAHCGAPRRPPGARRRRRRRRAPGRAAAVTAPRAGAAATAAPRLRRRHAPPRAARAPVTPATPAEPCAGRVRRRLRDEEPSGGEAPGEDGPRACGGLRARSKGRAARRRRLRRRGEGGGGGAAGAGAPLPQSAPALVAGRGLSSPLLVAGGRALFGRGLRMLARGAHVAQTLPPCASLGLPPRAVSARAAPGARPRSAGRHLGVYGPRV